MSIFGDLERLIADLYPYRVPITVGLALIIAAVLAFGYRQGWHLALWRHRLASAVVAMVVVAATVPVGNYLLSPLWERSFLDEESPLALASEDARPTPAIAIGEPSPIADDVDVGQPPSGEPTLTHRGEVVGADDFHFGRGSALLIETAPGRYTLRFEEFSVRNGPDLFVYLAADPNSIARALDLGELKATDGAFNYEVPPGTDVSQFGYAIVWCRQFAVLFASAALVEIS